MISLYNYEQKLRNKQQSDPAKFKTFYAMLNDEVKDGMSEDGNSATVALLWLTRSVRWLRF